MEIYPEQQFLLLLSAFTAGAVLGAFYEVLRAFRILFGVLPVPARLTFLYRKKLPLLQKCVPLRETRAKKARRTVVVAIGDFLFMTVAAITLEFLLYDYNYGEFRPSALFLMLAGFALWRVSVARLFARVTPYLAFALSAAGLYLRALLLLPFRGAAALAKLLGRPVLALVRRIRRQRLKKYSAALCRRQLQFAALGFGYLKKEGSKDDKNGTGKKHKTAVCDTASHTPHFYCRPRDLRPQTDGIQPQGTGGGGVGEGKRAYRRIRAKTRAGRRGMSRGTD